MYISVAFVNYLWDTPPASDENHCVVGVQILSDIQLAIKKNLCCFHSESNRESNFQSASAMKLQLGVNVPRHYYCEIVSA